MAWTVLWLKWKKTQWDEWGTASTTLIFWPMQPVRLAIGIRQPPGQKRGLIGSSLYRKRTEKGKDHQSNNNVCWATTTTSTIISFQVYFDGRHVIWNDFRFESCILLQDTHLGRNAQFGKIPLSSTRF